MSANGRIDCSSKFRRTVLSIVELHKHSFLFIRTWGWKSESKTKERSKENYEHPSLAWFLRKRVWFWVAWSADFTLQKCIRVWSIWLGFELSFSEFWDIFTKFWITELLGHTNPWFDHSQVAQPHFFDLQPVMIAAGNHKNESGENPESGTFITMLGFPRIH